MPAPDVEEALVEIQEWMARDGFQVREVRDPHSATTLEATRTEDYAYALVHPDEGADHVHVSVSLPGEELEDALADAPDEEVDVFLTDLRFGLLSMDVEFEGLDLPTEAVTLFVPAYFDGLSKDRFMEKVRAVKNAALFLEWSLGPAEEAPPAPEPGGDRYIR
jgi:hypothetical protein